MSGMGMKMQSWTLDGLTGLWRENKDGLAIKPWYTKSREKVGQCSNSMGLCCGELDVVCVHIAIFNRSVEVVVKYIATDAVV